MSNLKKVEFRPEENTNAQLIELLEECLLRAKSGEYTEGFVVLTHFKKGYQTWYRTGMDMIYTIGVVEQIKHTLMKDCHA